MAAVAHSQTTHDGPTTTSSTTYISVATIASTEFVATGDYLLLVTAQVGTSNDANDENHFRVVHGSTSFPSSELEGEFNADYGFVYSWWTVFTQPATAEAIGFEMRNIGGTDTANVRNLRMVAIRLDADFTENTDWYFNESSTLEQHTTTFSSTNRASLSWTPGTAGDDWLVLSRFRVQTVNINVNHGYRMMVGATGSETQRRRNLSREREDPVQDETIYSQAWLYSSVPASGQSAIVESRDDTSGGADQNDHSHSAVFVLNLSAFEAVTSAENASYDYTGSGLTSFEQQLSVSHTPSTTGDQLIIADTFCVFSTGSHDARWRLQEGATSYPNSDWETRNSMDANDSTDRFNGPMMFIQSLSAASHTLDLDVAATNSSNDFEAGIIIAISMELGAAAATSNATLGLLAAAT